MMDWIDEPKKYGINPDTREKLIRMGVPQMAVDSTPFEIILILERRFL